MHAVTGGGEFDFIARLFQPLAGEGALDLRDDAALVAGRAGYELAISTDTIVESTHFLPDDPAGSVGRKLLRVNLSDCAAMGAEPFGWFLNVARPPARDEAWFIDFADGLAADQRRFGVRLLGGDTTGTSGPLVLTATILAWVRHGEALRRNGARVGDDLWITGTIGDATLGLAALRGACADPDGSLTQRYRVPEPRLGMRLHGIAHAALDVSDGLVQDCGHIARESGVAITIEAASVPLSAAARSSGAAIGRLLAGGDDYELLLAVPPSRAAALQAEAARAGIAVTRIGRVWEAAAGGRVMVLGADGAPLALPRGGWQHF
ncbi:thiamine-phosphate kinase [Acidomonas methanolica]|nr:thiamine-phosphate kinase [Acidomonas methanolica]